MLPKANRLTKKKDFNLVFQKGESLKADFLTCKVLRNNLKKARFGFVVSKKVSKKATTRNKVKRRLRAAVLGELKNILKSVDAVIVALPGADKKDSVSTKKAVALLINKMSDKKPN